jgi:hypothetical protein
MRVDVIISKRKLETCMLKLPETSIDYRREIGYSLDRAVIPDLKGIFFVDD